MEKAFLILILFVLLASVAGAQLQPPVQTGTYSGSGTYAGSAAPVRLDVGSNTSYTDSKGDVWVSDVGTYNGTNAISTCVPNPTTAGTTDPILYRTQRFGNGNGTPSAPYLTYTINSLLPGQYTANLYFSECTFNSVGARQFNVSVQNTRVLTNFDIYVAAGNKQNTAVVKSFPTLVNSSGQLVIQFTPGAANNPIIAAIEILPAGDVTPPVIAIVNPALGTMTASTFVQVNVTDDVGVRTVAGTMDGYALVLLKSAPPLYTFSFDLATQRLGNHVLVVNATDFSANASSLTMNYGNAMTISFVAIPTIHMVTLKWLPPPPDPNYSVPTGYNVYRKLNTDSSYSASPIASTTVSTTFIDQSVSPGLIYIYRITSTNPNSVPPESTPSNEVAATIPTP